MQPCGTEPGSDAKIINLLTDHTIVSRVYNLPSPWSVESLLREIAGATEPYHALIDTGAMVTGFSNEQVARFMLANGIAWASAAVSTRPTRSRSACSDK